MSKKLVIKGHPTRGKEVIELLEMMGGNNRWNGSGVIPNLYYFISNECIIYSSQIEKDVVIFTLEEFLGKYPFKVGDKVFLYDNITEGCVTGMEWDEDKGTVKYCVYTSAECWCDVKELLKWNAIDLVEKHYGEQCEEMMKDITLKNLYELGTENIKKEIVTRMDVEDASFILNYMILPNKVNDELEYKFPVGYEFDKVENGKIILKPIKPKYPDNYEECCEVVVGRKVNPNEISFDKMKLCLVDLDNTQNIDFQNPYLFHLDCLFRLLMCRNAYWRIAGEEMGLDKSWEPKFGKYILYSIKFYLYQDSFVLHKGEYSSSDNCILVFPTEEIRDTFYDNFKDLIEQCKKFL